MSQHAIHREITLDTITCCRCDVIFAMPSTLVARLNRDGGSFYCPHGHGQHFTQTEVDRLRGMLEQANRRNTELVDEVARVQREKKRIERRVSAGVCPCCNRTFQNLARHMAAKHREAAP